MSDTGGSNTGTQQPDSYYANTGIQQPKPLRQEVDGWLADPDGNNEKQISLFYLAMAKFQSMPVTDKLSYWQVAGIHGQPLVPWDEDTQPQAQDLGHCTHNSLLFPTWHRPYINLFEQRTYETMLEIIKDYPDDIKPDWLAAARAWRLPYWDWAQKKFRLSGGWRGIPEYIYDLPIIAKNPSVEVTDGNVQKTIPNPFYKFTTPDGKTMGSYGNLGLTAVTDDGVTYPYDICISTSRCPPSYDPNDKASVQAWENGVENNRDVTAALQRHGWYEGKSYTDTLGEAVYHLFADGDFASYPAFATTRYVKQNQLPPAQYLSLEDIHNNIHNWTGGLNGGFMAEIPVAAFDPIFWLHHCNVDRQLAIWQTLNRHAWFEDTVDQLSDPWGNWSTKPGTLDTPETPLAPFRDRNGQYHTSNSARDWFNFEYTYPELQPWNFTVDSTLDWTAYIADINARLTELYSSTRNLILKHRTPQLISVKVVGENEPSYTLHDDYVVNIRYERYALGGASFSIHILIANKYHAGTVSNFCSPPSATSSNSAGCDNCHQQIEEGALQKGQVMLTNTLLTAIDDESERLQTLKREHVVEYLKGAIRWVVLGSRGQEIPLERIPSLKVYVAGGKGRHYDDARHISRYSDYEALPHITHGLPGGLGHNDDP